MNKIEPNILWLTSCTIDHDMNWNEFKSGINKFYQGFDFKNGIVHIQVCTLKFGKICTGDNENVKNT